MFIDKQCIMPGEWDCESIQKGSKMAVLFGIDFRTFFLTILWLIVGPFVLNSSLNFLILVTSSFGNDFCYDLLLFFEFFCTLRGPRIAFLTRGNN